MNFPDWVSKHKTKGTEVRVFKDKYYLYETSSKYNPDKKRAQKITGKYLGRITPDGLIPPKRNVVEQSLEKPAPVREFGATFFLDKISADIKNALQSFFGNIWSEIFATTCMRLLYKTPLKNIEYRFHESFISETFSNINLTDKSVGELFKLLGGDRPRIASYFRTFMPKVKNDSLMIDATQMLTNSEGIKSANVGYNAHREYSPQVNLVFIYSEIQKLPIFYRITPGNIREVKTFKLTLEESEIKDAVIITDKGYYSENNVKQLESEHLKFIMPLRRNSAIIDYATIIDKGMKGFDNYFKYQEKYIWHYTKKINKRQSVHLFMDQFLKTDEENDYLKRIETHPEENNIKEFHENNHKFGTLSILTNAVDQSPENIYNKYKTRNSIEVMIDALKNILQADHSYMRSNESLEGWLFCTFIALQMYYKLYKLLTEKQILSKYSPEDLLMHLSGIQKYKIGDKWRTSEINTKTMNLLRKLNIDIT